MTTRRFLLLGGAASAFAATSVLAKGHAALKLPVARVAPVTDIYWGEEVVDRYRWMETKPSTPEWTTWLKGQADYAAQELKRLPPQAKVKAALANYTAATSELFVAQVTDSQLLYIRRDPSQQVYCLYMRPIGGGKARLLIDPDKLGKPGQPVRMTWSDLSPDNRFLAYGLDAGGDEVEAVHILDVTTMQDVTVTMINSRQSGWMPDSSGYFYQRLRADAVPGALDYSKGASVWMHRPGSDPASDVEVFKSGEGPVARNWPTPPCRGSRPLPAASRVTPMSWVSIWSTAIRRAPSMSPGSPTWRSARRPGSRCAGPTTCPVTAVRKIWASR